MPCSAMRSFGRYVLFSLSLSDVVSGSGLVGDLERKVRNLVNYLESEQHKAILFLDKVAQDVAKRIRAAANDETVSLLCDRSYNPKLGARPAGTVIQEFIDDMVLWCTENADRNKPTSELVWNKQVARRMRISAVETDK